eukprot:m.323556 g.323556  ORF g.323556 m.323556 type:complete len:93 (+) comp20359_c5_seq1:1475-1753(+)
MDRKATLFTLFVTILGLAADFFFDLFGSACDSSRRLWCVTIPRSASNVKLLAWDNSPPSNPPPQDRPPIATTIRTMELKPSTNATHVVFPTA